MESINSLKNNKSPEADGIAPEFSKIFSKDLASFLVEVFCEGINKGVLPPTLTQGLITFLPKPNKDSLLIDNWHPIGLLNSNYKIHLGKTFKSCFG